MIEQKQKCKIELTFRFFSYQSAGKIRWQYEVDCRGWTVGKIGGWDSLEEAKNAAAEVWGYAENLTY